MASRHNLFRVFYGLGFTPWDGHALSTRLRELIEGTVDTPALPPEAALDVGCGTGDSSVYLARHGWHVTGVDFVPKALDKARAKARAAGVPVDIIHADVTHLSRAGLDRTFQLIVDNGCLHGMSDGDRDLYVREITAAAAPGARLLIVAAKPGGRSDFWDSMRRRSSTDSRSHGHCGRRPMNDWRLATGPPTDTHRSRWCATDSWCAAMCWSAPAKPAVQVSTATSAAGSGRRTWPPTHGPGPRRRPGPYRPDPDSP
jgi:SAM-dependent methyltransferase